MPVEVGSVLEGVVAGITNFGAFVQLPGGETGLVHISVDPKGKIGLSIKQAKPAPVEQKVPPRKKPQGSFEDRLARFMKDSEERLQTLRRSTDAKRGGRGGPGRKSD